MGQTLDVNASINNFVNKECKKTFISPSDMVASKTRDTDCSENVQLIP
jgi:hypothetical protein